MNANTMRDKDKIAQLNDLLRQTFLTGKVVLTPGIEALPDETRTRVLSMVRCYDEFNEGNNPDGERDYGAFELDGHSLQSIRINPLPRFFMP